MAHQIGEHFGGGIIFFVDNTGEHVLIAQPTDVVGTFNWKDAINVCKASTVGGFNDWFLPDKDQLNTLYLQKDIVGGFKRAFYWSSSPYVSYLAWSQIFDNGLSYFNNKNHPGYVRAVRGF